MLICNLICKDKLSIFNYISLDIPEGPGRYLLVSPSGVSHDGEDCDKAGVGYSAFASQPDRCNKPAGSCLRNQPLDFWLHDNVN